MPDLFQAQTRGFPMNLLPCMPVRRQLALLLAAALAVCSIASVSAQTLPAAVLKDLKAASVFIKVRAGSQDASGSGFLIQADGQAGTLVTNNHVIDVPGKTKPEITVVFWSGTPMEKTARATVIAADPQQDLAILRVTNFPGLPKPINISRKVELVETMRVYCFGFPFGKALAARKTNPAITVTPGSISSLRNNEQHELAAVQLDANLNPGNSGGPVLDAEGRLVGIAVAAVPNTRISLAIPPHQLSKLMLGKVGEVVITSLKVDKGMALLQVEAMLVDPLGKVKSASICYAAMSSDPKPDKSGQWAPLPLAQKVPLKITGNKAVGSMRVALDQRTLYQASCVSDGQTVHGRPTSFGTFFIVKLDAKADPKDTRILPPPADKDSLAVDTVNRSPNKYQGKTLTVRGYVFGSVTNQGGNHEVQVYGESNVRMGKVTFYLPKTLATEMTDEGLKQDLHLARLSGKLQRGQVKQHVFMISKIELLDGQGKPMKTMPTTIDPNAPPTLNAVNRDPSKFKSKTLQLKVMLSPGATIRGKVTELDTFNDKGAKPGNLSFHVTKSFAKKWSEAQPSPRTGQRYPATLTCKLAGSKDGNRSVITVTQIDVLDDAGKVVKTIK